MSTLYNELEVRPKASPETIRAAYKSLIQRYHPDRNPGRREFALRTQRLNEAYTVLSDPEQRAKYDAQLVAEQRLRQEREEARRQAADEAAARAAAATAELQREMEAAVRAKAAARQQTASEERRRQIREEEERRQAQSAAGERELEAMRARQRAAATASSTPAPPRSESPKPVSKRGGFIRGVGTLVLWGIGLWIVATVWDDATRVRAPQPKSVTPVAAAPSRAAQLATPLSQEAKNSFAIGIVPACVQEQRQERTNKLMTDAQLTEYCRCIGTVLSNAISVEDVDQFLRTKSNEHFRPRLEAAGYSCGQMLLKRWGYIK